MESPLNEKTRSTLIAKRGYRQDIVGDTLALYLSNNPMAAQWLANRIGDPSKVLLELCCAVGVTMEYLAPVFDKVIGIDIDRQALEACKDNLQKAGVSENSILIQGNVSNKEILKNVKADIVIYDIPYWYPDKYFQYTAEERNVENPDLVTLVADIRKYISEDIVIFAPPEMGYKYFSSVLGECEVVQVYINQKHDRNYIFLGNLIKEEGEGIITLSLAILNND